jgi:hypothetical protein
MFQPNTPAVQAGRSISYAQQPELDRRVQQIVPLTARISLSNLAASNPHDVWLYTPERGSVDRATLVADAYAEFDAVTVQFIQKNGGEVIELTPKDTFEFLNATEAFNLSVPGDLGVLPVFLRFTGPAAPIDAYLTAHIILDNTP